MTKAERWKPEMCEQYFLVDTDGSIGSFTWTGDAVDRTLYAVGNCFKTKTEAKSAAKKFKDLLLILHEPAAECAQLPKLTTEVFNREDCPEWARYAVVNSKGTLIFFGTKPTFEGEDYGCWSCSCSPYKHIRGIVFDHSDWENSLIERPAKLPDWCKVGEWIYIPTIREYMQIKKVEDDLLFDKEGDHIPYTRCTQARPRPYNVDEMKALVGKVINVNNGSAGLCTAYSAIYNEIKFDDESWTPEELMGDQFSIDGKPCFVLEHLENGKWAE